MKHTWIAIIMAGLVFSSCSSLPEENAELREEIGVTRTMLLQSYRDTFENYEYPKLNAFGKQGYDWFWKKSMLESGAFGTYNERERVFEEHGTSPGEHWVKGWYIAYSMWNKSLGRDPAELNLIFQNKTIERSE